jgi:glycosyltransferase involved in cell wall biosynthesis
LDQLKVLILTYTFPPSPEIGGRRWAKFFKCLNRESVEAHVLTQRRNAENPNEWHDDVIPWKKNIHEIDFGYPAIMNQKSYKLFEKIKYRLVRKRLKMNYQGNYYDRTCFFGEEQLQQVESLFFENNFTHVIISGGPFSWMASVVRLKEKFNNVKFILDFRDPWTNNQSFFGYSRLSRKRFEYEQELEANAIAECDLIISVSQEMNDWFIASYKINPNKCFVLPNGWDKDELVKVPNEISKNIVLAGTLYDNTREVFIEFLNAIRNPELKNRIQLNGIKFCFYGFQPEWIHKELSPEDPIKLYSKRSITEINEVISTSSGGMLFLTKDLTFSFSTKFYEYLKYDKPIFVFSNGGKTGKFIEDNGLGVQLTPKNMKSNVDKLIDWVEMEKVVRFNDKNDFEISTLSKSLVSTISKL